MTRRELLEQLEKDGLMQVENRGRVVQCLADAAAVKSDPVYIRVLAGFGAWVSALLFLPALGMMHVLDSAGAAIGWSVALLAGAVALSRLTRATFPTQLALALGIAGNLLIIFGVAESRHYHNALGPAVLAHSAV